MEKKIEKINKLCALCGKTYKTNELDLLPCPYCGWYNDIMCEENPDKVIYRNLVSFNKAKILYKQGKKLTPTIHDFLEAFEFYGEVEFKYKGFLCQLDRSKENGIEFGWNPNNIQYFKDKEDFIKNAKIGNEYVREIWDKVEDPSYV